MITGMPTVQVSAGSDHLCYYNAADRAIQGVGGILLCSNFHLSQDERTLIEI